MTSVKNTWTLNSRRLRWSLLGLSWLACWIAWSLNTKTIGAEKATDSEIRLLNDVKYLASDEMEGRGVGTKGLDLAADYIREQFEKAGLNVTAVNGGAFQNFTMTTGSRMKEPNTLVFNGPDQAKIELKLGEHFTPVSFSSAGKFNSDIVFCGYGIDATDKDYKDFAGVDVQGKIVIVMRREPRQGRPEEGLGGGHGRQSPHADLRSKVNQAAQHGAAAILLVDDPHSARADVDKRKQAATRQAEQVAEAAVALEIAKPDDQAAQQQARQALSQATQQYQRVKAEFEKGESDQLMNYGYGGHESSRQLPILHITRKTCDELLKASLKKTLVELEREIDSDLKPRSAALAGWTATGETSVEKVVANVKNVIGVLEGEGPLANETVVIGAHYDHVGRGGANSLSPGNQDIHNGADDNASGTGALIELARRFGAGPKPERRIVFIAFTAEESGLIGSAHYCKEPVFPLENTIAMLNMDMVGRLSQGKLTVFGNGTAKHWNEMLESLKSAKAFQLSLQPEGFGPSDHHSFYTKKIPVLHFFTGTHADYHRPGDDWDKLNSRGMEQVADLVEEIARHTIARKERPEYVLVQGSANVGREGSRPYFGSIPDFGSDKPGYLLGGVAPGSPADKGGLKSGDRIVKVGTHQITGLDDFDLALRKFSPGEAVDVTVMRGEQSVTVKVTLEKPR